MHRRKFTGLALACAGLILAGPALAADAPANWEGLVRVKSKKLPLVYLQPGADFRVYHKVMIDPTEVAFRKTWKRDYNQTVTGLSGRVSDADVEKAVQQGAKAASDIFAEAFTEAGYPVVDEPGPDVLRVRTGVINVSVNAPDIPKPGRSHTFAGEAGEASLVVEVRDSQTGAILGRAVDRKLAGDNTARLRNRVTNRSDFRILVKSWAKTSARGLNELKALSPVTAEGVHQK